MDTKLLATMEMITPRELSQMLRIPVRTIVRLASGGKIPACKVGKQWRFSRQEIETWLRANAANIRHRVAVIEDDPAILDVLTKLLRGAGFEVLPCPDGKTALELFGKDRDFSLVLLDLKLPDMTGADILEWMKKKELRLPVLIVTGLADSEIMAKSLAFGPFTVIQKPFRNQELLATVEGLVNFSTQPSDHP